MSVSAVNVRDVRGDIARGYKQTEKNRHSIQVYKSNKVASTETDTGITLFNLPGNSLVIDAFVHVTTAFDASGSSAAATATLVVANDTLSETVWDANLVGMQSTGSKFATSAGIVMPDSGGSVVLLPVMGTTTAGQLEVYVEILQPENLL